MNIELKMAEEYINNLKKERENIVRYNINKMLENKELKVLYDKCQDLKIKIAKDEVGGKKSKYRKDFDLTKILLHNKCKDNNIDITQLKYIPICDQCKDFGYVNGKMCKCLKKVYSNLLLESSGLKDKKLPQFSSESLKCFENSKNYKDIEQLYKILKKYSINLHLAEKRTITLIGNTGVGKTYLLQCVVSECIKNGYLVFYTTAFNFNQQLLKIHLSSLQEKQEIINEFLNCDLLCIDDLGTENILKNVTVEYFYNILNERIANNKSTIITTNLMPEQLREIYDERIFSRLTDQKNSILIKFDGDDLRLKK